MSTKDGKPDAIEEWVVKKYGPISETTASVEGVFQVVAVCVPLYKGAAMGLGPNRKLAIHDLYLDLALVPELPTELTGFWKSRRNQLRADAGLEVIT